VHGLREGGAFFFWQASEEVIKQGRVRAELESKQRRLMLNLEIKKIDV
jgi:hypothetical protein